MNVSNSAKESVGVSVILEKKKSFGASVGVMIRFFFFFSFAYCDEVFHAPRDFPVR